jgi:hypothetical protein
MKEIFQGGSSGAQSVGVCSEQFALLIAAMNYGMKQFACLGLFLSLVGCSSDAKDPAAETDTLPAVDCAAETVPKYSEVTLFKTTCVTCHSSSKTGDARKGAGAEAAPAAINFDTYVAAKASAITAAEELYEDERGAMPPEDSGLNPATESEKKQVLVWAKCGTPK